MSSARVDRRLAAGWILGVAAQLSVIGLLLTSAWLISRAAQHPPVLYLMVAIVGVRAFGIGRSVLRYGERLLTHDAALARLTRERVAAYVALDRAAPAGLAGERRGDLVNTVVADIDALQDRQLRVRLPFTVNLCAEACVVVLVVWLDRPTGLMLATVIAALQLGIPVLVAHQGGVRQRSVAGLHGAMSAQLAEAVAAAPDLVAYGATGPVRARLLDVDRQLVRAQREAAWLNGLASALVLIGVGAAVCLSALTASAAVASGGLRPTLLAVLVLAPVALLEPLDSIPAIEQQRQRVRASVDRIKALASVRGPRHEPDRPEPLPEDATLVVNDLRVGWNGHVAAQGIDFALREGDVLSVGGPSGSGKSTLGMTLLGLLEPMGGTVTLGGVDLRRLDGTAVRRRVGLLEQDGHIFATSIRENLRIARPDGTDAEFEHALGQAGLLAFVRTLPDGLDTEVGEHGNRLSGGERQRLGLARLLLAGHRILILDEPTEHLDRPTAEALLDDVLALSPARSLIVITHAAWVRERIGMSVALEAA